MRGSSSEFLPLPGMGLVWTYTDSGVAMLVALWYVFNLLCYDDAVWPAFNSLDPENFRDKSYQLRNSLPGGWRLG